MKKKLYIALSAVAVLAVVIVAVATQSNYFKGDFRPLSGPCDKPLSVTGPASRQVRPASGAKPLSNPCGRPASVQKIDRNEKTINKYIAPNVPVEMKKVAPRKSIAPNKVIAPAAKTAPVRK